MKRLLINGVSFTLLMVAIIIVLDCLSMREDVGTILAKWTNSEEYITTNTGTGEICPYIEKARQNDNTTKLIIGDSVCRQLFQGLQEINPDFSIIACNASVTMSGQYILASEYLDNHPNTTDVFLIVIPVSLQQGYSTNWGYQYAVMPFVETDTINKLDEKTILDMKSVYGELFLRKDMVWAVDKSAINKKLYLNYLEKYGTPYNPNPTLEIANRYVGEIYELCLERGVAFHLYPGPVCEIKCEQVEDMRTEFVVSDLYHINPNYLDMIQYFPVDWSEDNIHFFGDYASRDFFNYLIEKHYADTELLDYLVIE